MAAHELKSWPEFYQKIKSGEKRFDIRLNDRSFKVGDTLHLREWSPDNQKYTGDECRVKVDYIMANYPGLQAGYVAMSITLIPIWAKS
jgi:hypothetical protein